MLRHAYEAKSERKFLILILKCRVIELIKIRDYMTIKFFN